MRLRSESLRGWDGDGHGFDSRRLHIPARPNNERSIVSGEATGVLEILPGDTDTSGIKRFEWNGDADDRAAARTAFEEVVAYGGVLATVVDAPGHATQVRTFDEVEEIERERGTVAVQVSRQIVGG